MSSHQLGLLWCAVFVALDAAQAVAFGSLLQAHDAFLVGALVFGASALASLAFVAIAAPAELAAAWRDRRSLAWLNVHSAGGWIAYLAAVQLIEPAMAFTIFSGVIPLVLRLASAPCERASPRSGRADLGFAIVALALVLLALATLAGLSGFVRGGPGVAAAGVLLSVVSGAMMAGMLRASYRLSAQGAGPLTVYGVRFPLYVTLALAGYALGLDAKGAVDGPALAAAFALGLLLLAFPTYAVQKAVSLTSPAAVGAATAIIPAVVFGLQIVEGRVAFSAATLTGLALYAFGAALVASAAFGERNAVL